MKQRDPFFSTMWTIIYMLLTNYRSYLVTLGKKDYKSSQWKNESETLQKIAHPFPEDFLAETDAAFKKSYSILCAFEVLNVDNLNKQQSNLVNLFETSIRVLANFYGAEQVDELQGKKSKVDAIIDKDEVMKDLSGFLLDSKDAFQCHNKKTNQAAADLKEKLTKEKKAADKIKKMVETFIDENSFTNPVWYCIMVNKHEKKALYPNMMSLLKLCVIIPSSTAERGFSGVKLLESKYAAQYIRYFNANLSVWRLTYL